MFDIISALARDRYYIFSATALSVAKENNIVYICKPALHCEKCEKAQENIIRNFSFSQKSHGKSKKKKKNVV